MRASPNDLRCKGSAAWGVTNVERGAKADMPGRGDMGLPGSASTSTIHPAANAPCWRRTWPAGPQSAQRGGRARSCEMPRQLCHLEPPIGLAALRSVLVARAAISAHSAHSRCQPWQVRPRQQRRGQPGRSGPARSSNCPISTSGSTGSVGSPAIAKILACLLPSCAWHRTEPRAGAERMDSMAARGDETGLVSWTGCVAG